MNSFWKDFYKDQNTPLIYPDENLVRLIKKLNISSGIALDIGCGDGRHLKLLKDIGLSTVVGIDRYSISPYFKGDGFIIADATNLPFKSKKFDLVIMWGVIHYIREYSKALSEIRRVLKNKGYLILSIRSKEDTHLIKKMKDQYFHLFDINEIEELFNKGWEIIFIQKVKRTLINELDTVISHINLCLKKI